MFLVFQPKLLASEELEVKGIVCDAETGLKPIDEIKTKLKKNKTKKRKGE